MQKDIFIQARMGSTRRPGKVLQEVGGVPILLRMYDRISKSKLAKNIVIITTTNEIDDKIFDLCISMGILVYRGSETDLLDRHYQAALKFGSDYIFKIPSDCPLADPEVIDQVLKLSYDYEYVSNYHPPTFPDGMDVEGCSFKLLELAWKNAELPHEREHTFPYIWDQPDKFSLGNVVNPYGDMFKSHRWTIDYEEDLQFMEAIFSEFDYSNDFSFGDVLTLLQEKPSLKRINAKYNGVNWYRKEVGNLKTIDESLFNEEPADEKP